MIKISVLKKCYPYKNEYTVQLPKRMFHRKSLRIVIDPEAFQINFMKKIHFLLLYMLLFNHTYLLQSKFH